MSDELHPGTPDPAALRRRVLLTGALALALYVAVTVGMVSAGVPDLYLVPVVVLLYLGVIRPLMRPVRDANRLRRRLAQQAWLEQRERER